MLNNIGLPGLILLGLVLWLVIWLVKPSKRKLDEAADQKRIADSLEQIAKSKKDDKDWTPCAPYS